MQPGTNWSLKSIILLSETTLQRKIQPTTQQRQDFLLYSLILYASLLMYSASYESCNNTSAFVLVLCSHSQIFRIDKITEATSLFQHKVETALIGILSAFFCFLNFCWKNVEAATNIIIQLNTNFCRPNVALRGNLILSTWTTDKMTEHLLLNCSQISFLMDDSSFFKVMRDHLTWPI